MATADDGQTSTSPTGSAAAGTPYAFVGETLALDFVNTEVVVRGKRVDLLDLPGGYHNWWRAARDEHPESADIALPADGESGMGLVAAAKDFRRALRQLFEAVAEGKPIDPHVLAVLNEVLSTGYEVIRTGATGKLETLRRSRSVGSAAALLPVALSARDLLVDRDVARLHLCGNDRCILLFYDTTRSGTRRWCSTGCMNRARSSQRYRERKQMSLNQRG